MNRKRNCKQVARRTKQGTITLAVTGLLVLQALGARPTRGDWELPFKLQQGHFIVVEGSVRGEDVTLMVDSGATHSVIDRRLIRTLGLKPVSDTVQLSAYRVGRKARRVMLHGLRLGPIVTSLTGLIDDLSWAGVDIIVGLDLLRDRTHLANVESGEVLKERGLVIDFENRTISFRVMDELEASVPMLSERGQVIVGIRVDDKPLRVAVDSGARRINLFRSRQDDWVKQMKRVRTFEILFLGAVRKVAGMQLERVQLGPSEWTDQIGAVHEVDPGETDGVLGLVSLELKRIHFDFEGNVISWER